MVLLKRVAPVIVGFVLVIVMAILPLLILSLPGILPGPTYTPGSLALLSLCMVFAALALSYNLLLGSAGMLSFGHALYFGAGAYGLGILLDAFALPLWPGVFVALIGGMVIALVTGAVRDAGERHPLRDGHLGFRAGGIGAGPAQRSGHRR